MINVEAMFAAKFAEIEARLKAVEPCQFQWDYPPQGERKWIGDGEQICEHCSALRTVPRQRRR